MSLNYYKQKKFREFKKLKHNSECKKVNNNDENSRCKENIDTTVQLNDNVHLSQVMLDGEETFKLSETNSVHSDNDSNINSSSENNSDCVVFNEEVNNVSDIQSKIQRRLII